MQATAVRSRLAGLRARVRAATLLSGAGTLLLATLGLCLLSFALDRTLRLTVEARAVVLLLSLAGLGWIAWARIVRPLRTPLPDRELARVVEGLTPALDWRLLAAVEFSDPSWQPEGPHVSRSLAGLVVADAERLSGEVDAGSIVPTGPMLRSGARAAAFLLAGLALLSSFPEAARIWALRNLLLSSSALWPRDTRLTLLEPVRLTRDDGAADVGTRVACPRGSDLTITVIASGVVPSRVYLDTTDEEGRDERIALDALGLTETGQEKSGKFRTSLLQLTEGFSFRITGGDDELGPIEVVVRRRPWIEAVEFEVAPPAYTGLPARKFGLEAGNVTLPRGTRVAVTVKSSKPLVSGRLVEQAVGAETAAVHTGSLAGVAGPAADAAGTRAFRSELELDRTAVFAVELVDEDGLSPDQPTRFSLAAQPDAPPEVLLRLRGVGLNISPRARLRWEVAARDDHGLSGGTLHWKLAVPSQPERAEKETLNGLTPNPPSPAADAAGLLELERKRLVPKSSVTIWAEALDKDPRGPNLGVSASIQLRVVDEETLLNELLRRLHEQRQEMERMIGEEERLAQGLGGADEATLERAPRTQRDVARTVLRAAEVVEQVAEEVETNQLLDEQAVQQMLTDVATPLRELEETTLAECRTLAEAAQAAQGEARPGAMSKAGGASARAAQELRAIVARMVRIEDLAELIALLKRTIRRQEDLLDKTRPPR